MDKLILFDPEFKKFQDFIKWLEDNKHAIIDDARLSSELRHKNELAESDEYSREFSSEFSSEEMTASMEPSVNLQDLIWFTDMILQDINESINSNIHSIDLELHIELSLKRKSFLEERCKTYAHQLYDMMTTIINCDEHYLTFFKSYDIVYRLVINTDGVESAIYLRRLVTIARSVMPAVQRYLETEIVEGGITSKSNVPEAK